VVSPDGAYGLFWGPLGLSIDDRHTHGQRFVMIVAVTLTATMAWSPDSAAFVVNHRVASDLEIAYLFDAKTLDEIDLGGRIAATDPELKRFIPPRGQFAWVAFPCLAMAGRGPCSSGSARPHGWESCR
jgi:hypothetical protein